MMKKSMALTFMILVALTSLVHWLIFATDRETISKPMQSSSGVQENKTELLPSSMCPNMVPNPNVWSTLFELARKELGFPNDQIIAKEIDETAIDNFFKFNSGGIGYTSPDKQHHMAYLRIFKAGNDQIRFNLVDMLQKQGGIVSENHTISDLQLTNQTCVVTAVRDPIDRFLSGYNEVEYRREVRDRLNSGSKSSSGPSYTRWGNGTTDRFQQFVTDFIGGPQSSGIYQFKRYGIQEISHVFSMTGVLSSLKRINDCHGGTSPNLTMTGYLPSLHNLDVEFPIFLSETCPGLHHLGSFEKQFVHDSQADKFNFHSAAKQVWKNQGAISRALCIIHSLDYACFDSLPVPSICQSVYADQTFKDKVMDALSTWRKNDPPCNDNMNIAGGGAAALTKLRLSNNRTTYRMALVTADNLLGDIVSHPMEEKYRIIKKSNPAFAVPGGSDLILASGFTVQTRDDNVEYYVLTPTADAWPKLVGAQKEVQRALRENME